MTKHLHILTGGSRGMGLAMGLQLLAQALSEACSTLEQSYLQGQWPADAASQVTGIMQFAVKTCEALQDFMAQTGPAAD